MVYLGLALAGLRQEDGSNAGGIVAGLMGVGFLAFMALFALLLIASAWKIFTKAGKPGWASLIPIYNMVVLLEIVGKPLWWIVLFFIPLVNFIAAIMIAIALAEKFGKSTGFAMGLVFLAPIFYPMLAFGDARYKG